MNLIYILLNELTSIVTLYLFFWTLLPLFTKQRNPYGLLKNTWKDDFFWYHYIVSMLIPTIIGIDLARQLSPKIPELITITFIPNYFKFILAFFCFEFMAYWFHRLMHKVDFLWEIHKIHHSSVELTSISADRNHWIENFIMLPSVILPLRLLGFSPDILFPVAFTYAFLGPFHHANINLDPHLIRKFLGTPNFHAWHHSSQQHIRGGQNFGGFLSIWDRIFGTAYFSNTPPTEFGFKGMDVSLPKGLIARQLHPIPIIFKKITRRFF